MIQISSIYELQKIGNDPAYPLDGEYELTQDIDARETVNWNDGSGFEPIGKLNNPFTGKFDGKNYKIVNLHINRHNTNCVGLFRYTSSNSEIKNVGIVNTIVSGSNCVGSLIGLNYGTVTNCYSTGLSTGRNKVGGLLGWNEGTVTNCHSIGKVSGINFVGGLVGGNYYGTLNNCYSKCTISGDWRVGKLVGYNEGTVSNCYSSFFALKYKCSLEDIVDFTIKFMLVIGASWILYSIVFWLATLLKTIFLSWYK